ncbi:type I glyceraldehyde-3-phosphate dehydrogenase [Halarsenatibacter silvermanii]|uniref:Glyceraldehyde-3-phosphate dehydrogenase n=1 Tax=Halarsenatibacter silvermanii TaxID=321763 RepID=A0A1G9RPF8_9FIRM|nr:type I glyceraldehyde-3-phosphate dehydrogenase [Halarsenatibacter silvermanii]SDM25229.1 glyceraldehyde 3-phosphate dehydrogenase [Halarsenatibacter silvermanii]
MTVKIGINGFGRIGRSVFRSAFDSEDVEFVGINDLIEPRTLAYMLKYDSNYGEFEAEVDHTDSSIVVDGEEIPVCQEEDPADIPWADVGAEVVLECTGLFRDGEEAAGHLEAGADKVLISAPADNEDCTVVMGVNDEDYDPAEHDVVSNASCTTNALGPVAKVLQDEFGIEKGLMTTVHAYTTSQNILDGPYSWKKITRGRAAAENIVPTTTGAAKAITEVMPELKGKLDGMAMRVPTPTGSVVDLVVDLEEEVTEEDINEAMKSAAEGELEGILGYTEDPLVSRDVFADSRSSIYDPNHTKVISGNQVKILSWYDNEWGYACRLVDMAVRMKELGL